MLPESESPKPMLPETALAYFEFIFNRPVVVKILNSHFEASGTEVRTSDLVELFKEPDFIKYFKKEMARQKECNIRKALLGTLEIIENKKGLILPEGEEKTRLFRLTKAMRESFNTRITGGKVNSFINYRPPCWQEECVANYEAGQGCDTEDQNIIDLCVRLFEPGHNSLGHRDSSEGVRWA